MKNFTFFSFTICSTIAIIIFTLKLKAQDSLVFYSDTTVICTNITEPDISCEYKPGPGNEGYEWTLPGYSHGIDWGIPLTEPTIGGWTLIPINYPGVHWIWPRNSNGLSCEHAFFRHSFVIPDSTIVTFSTIEITADNEYIFYLNGVEIGNDGDCQDPYEGDLWKTAEIYELETSLFNCDGGENILAVHCYDNWSVAGLRYQLKIDLMPTSSGIDYPDTKSNSGLINVYPNPFTNKTTIEFINPENINYNLMITNLAGNKVFEMDNIKSDKIEFERGNLAKGVYLIELKGEKVFWGKLVVR
ncbi:MAG: T9SS type A sorting domain-containing protein [Bacteroidetes bacterium]|nr:T9SS type A sorting domain-containing protein [Bacteroidota bacterium]MBL7102890.1 T9SS type A sorting domain-containing protein [Bacteroidales bacterium]